MWSWIELNFIRNHNEYFFLSFVICFCDMLTVNITVKYIYVTNKINEINGSRIKSTFYVSYESWDECANNKAV